ncbi:MAG: TolC family protein [Fibrobacteria bacterium]|nr:TolC family protein [Fibrobacteria bacterium]
MKSFLLYAFLFSGILFSQTRVLHLDYIQFENKVLENYPLIHEKKLEIKKQKLKVRDVKTSAILPKFELNLGMGPAPGLNVSVDKKYLQTSGADDSSRWIEESNRNYDFLNWGPTFGLSAKAVQPLNIYRFQAGLNAAKLNVEVAELAHYKHKIKVSLEAQEIYYGYLYAKKMKIETAKAMKDFKDAEEKIEEMLDDEVESINQKDLLKLKANRHKLEKGYNQSMTGFSRALMGAHFYLFLPDSVEFSPADSVLVQSTIELPPLDSLKLVALKSHPDLRRLENGIEARRELIKVAKGELGPDIFLFGGFEYTKTWSPDRESGGKDAFTKDPLNDLYGYGGLGIRVSLNFWSRFQKFKTQRIELNMLKRKEVYAARGILILLEEAWLKYLEAKANLKSSSNSLRAAEAWLKGAAMDYDLDPSLAKEMITPYKETLYTKKDYFEAIFQYNMAIGEVIAATGWTLSDYLSKVSK